MSKLRVALLTTFALGLFATAAVAKERKKEEKPPAWFHSSVTIKNKSHYAIHHLYMSSTDDDKWGPDQLGKDILEPGDTVKLTHVDCDDYDLKLVDEDGDVCIVQDVDLCLEDAVWDLDDKSLATCQAFTEDDD